jgi:hypothetical protein
MTKMKSRWAYNPTEKGIRNFALHLALEVRNRGGLLVLRERYGKRKKIGTYRTWPAVGRAVKRYGDEALTSKQR